MRSCCGIGSGWQAEPPAPPPKMQASVCGGAGGFRLRVLVGLLLVAAVCPAQDYVDRVVERARKEFEVPGIACGHRQGRQRGARQRVRSAETGRSGAGDAHSLFRIASNTKAFTARRWPCWWMRQASLGRRGDPTHARFPDVRPVRHPRVDRAGPAGASQRGWGWARAT